MPRFTGRVERHRPNQIVARNARHRIGAAAGIFGGLVALNQGAEFARNLLGDQIINRARGQAGDLFQRGLQGVQNAGQAVEGLQQRGIQNFFREGEDNMEVQQHQGQKRAAEGEISEDDGKVARMDGAGNGSMGGGGSSSNGGQPKLLWSPFKNDFAILPFERTITQLVTLKDLAGVDWSTTSQLWYDRIEQGAIQIPKGVVKIHSCMTKLSELIITQTVLNAAGGTASTATTYNNSPYMVLLQDRQNQVDTLAQTAQLNNTGVVASWTAGGKFENTCVEVTQGRIGGMEAAIWKMGDEPVIFEYQCFEGWISTKDNTAALPFSNRRSSNYMRTPGNQNVYHQTYPKVPHYVGIGQVNGVNGPEKISAQFIVQRRVTGLELVWTLSEPYSNVAYLKPWVAGAADLYSVDVRTSDANVNVHAIAEIGAPALDM